MDADVIVVGAGLAGLVVTAELASANRSVLLLEQRPRALAGGQAHWSLGGLFLIGTGQQRALGIMDRAELAWRDWQAAAEFGDGDDWSMRWAAAYVDFAAGEAGSWLAAAGHRLLPVVRWANRTANSVPRFHLTAGAGPGVVEPFAQRVAEAAHRGLVKVTARHQVTGLIRSGAAVIGVRGTVLSAGAADSPQPGGEFERSAQAVVIATGGIGGNHELVRAHWPDRLGAPPASLLAGVPPHVDGRMLQVAADTGAQVRHLDRMWTYAEGVPSWNPAWPGHGVRLLPGPSALWIGASGRRLPPPVFPGADPLAAVECVRATGHDHTWLLLTRPILKTEIAVSGAEYQSSLSRSASAGSPVDVFRRACPDVVIADDLASLVRGMNALTPSTPLAPGALRGVIEAFEADPLDPQALAVATARATGRVRVAEPHSFLDPRARPLTAIRLRLLTRKTLGGLATDLDGRVLDTAGTPIPGLYAAGEAAGFGGGGMHGMRSLEGTFLGGCLFSGRRVGRALAAAV